MKTLLSAFLLLLMTACSTTYPAVTQYRIAPQESVQTLHKSSCKQHSVKVAQAFVRSSLMSKKMKYVVGEYQEGAFNQSEWAEDPNRAITDAIVKSLQSSSIFESVASYRSFSASDYTLESNVAEFTQHFSLDEKSSYVKIDITFRLVNNQTMQVVAVKHIVKELAAKKADAPSGVEALNVLLTQSLREMQEWIAKSCK